MLSLSICKVLLTLFWTQSVFAAPQNSIVAQRLSTILPPLNINLPLPQLIPYNYSTTTPSPYTTAWSTYTTTPPVQNRFSETGPPTFSSLVPTPQVNNQLAIREQYRRIAQGAQQFGLELLSQFSDVLQRLGSRRDFMISPFAIWSLLLLLMEAASGDTLLQLNKALHITDNDQAAFRRAYREVTNYLRVNTSTIEVASMQALFTDINQPVNRDFENLIERDYGSKLIPVNFHDPIATTDRINSDVRDLTRGFIQYTVLPQDLKDANLFLLSALYFKGQWKHPFNRSLTHTTTFYDENDQPVGEVEMMTQLANFNYAGMNELEAHVLELPYGKEDRLSMLIILPRKGVTINKVVHNLQQVGIQAIFQKLAESAVGYEDEDVEVFMPRFNTSSDLALTTILEDLGILDIFSPSVADLSKMSPKVYVSQIIHTTRIIVNEEGTEAAAVASAVLANKATPPKFLLNRPFLYLIIEKSTNVLLFAGQLTNPNFK